MRRQKAIILVLEDEKALQAVIKSKLATENFSVLTAKTADQALDHLRSAAKIDVIWLDHYLSGKKSGLDFVAELKKNKQWKDLPIVVVSNTISESKISLYLSLGVQKCYRKVDYKLETIVADINKLLGGGKV